jgi:RNA polymerase sigma-70 factor (ECF subfamily)
VLSFEDRGAQTPLEEPRPHSGHRAFIAHALSWSHEYDPLLAALRERWNSEFFVPSADGILQRVAAGEPDAVRACIDRFGGLIWSLARRLTQSDAEAEDAVQEIFVEIWRSAERYDPSIASETAFVAMIARRRLIDRRRKRDRRVDRQALGEADPAAPLTTPSVTEEAGRASRALDQLSEDQKRVLTLSIYHGLSHEKISRSLNIPLGTVKTHARRGLIRLREILGLPDSASPAGGGGT